MSVPKIIHQIWIGPKPAPINLMNTWKEKNPDFEYIFWNEEEFAKRNIKFICQNRINEMEEYCGKADIMRWEILYRFGGIYIDADSFCVEPIDDILCSNSFAGWENEIRRNGLIAVGTMGFCVNHEIPRIAIEIIKNNEVSYAKTQKRAWQNTGPLLLTNIYNKLPDKKIFNILPSYLFLPHHYTGEKYNGHGKIYAYQAWGSTFESYNEMNQIQLPIQFLKPPKEHSVSILISSYNTKCSYIQECLESIKHQQGLFNIELVWINDGSDVLNTAILKSCLDNFAKTTRFTTIVYEENDGNKGIGYTLNKGITMCSNEIIIKMDSDDIMVSNRIGMQLQYMFMNPTVAICGGQINMFKDNPRNIVNKTDHKSLTFDAFKTNPSHWFVNHPTLCYRKSCVLAAGNYDVTWVKTEDFELMLRMLKKYGYIHNMSNVLLYYRLHENQITHNGCSEGRGHWHKIRTDLINKTINS